MIKRPMKGTEVIHKDGKHGVEDLRFPLYVSPKLDGIRALVCGGKLLSSKLKLIPNKHVRSMFKHLEGLDGELLIVQPGTELIFRNTSSAVMSREGTPRVIFHVFDYHNARGMSFRRRQELVQEVVEDHSPGCPVRIVEQVLVSRLETLLAYEKKILAKGYEGVMLRSPDGVYKEGRGTWREHSMLKLKRFVQEEAKVIGFEEQMKNNNPQKVNELGLKKRSSHKENMAGKDTLGALIVKSKKYEREFTVGGGFSDEERLDIWNNQKKYKGKLVTFKFFAYGDYDVPRHPTFIGFRERIDL